MFWVIKFYNVGRHPDTSTLLMPIFTQICLPAFYLFSSWKKWKQIWRWSPRWQPPESWQFNRRMMSWRLVNYFDFQITFQLTNFQTFSINASILLKLWRGRCSGGWLEGKEWATLTTSPDRIRLYCGRYYSEVVMRLLARKWKSQMQKPFFSVFSCDRFAQSANYLTILTNFMMLFL